METGTYKIYQIKVNCVRADGTPYTYIEKRKVQLKGYKRADGSRQPKTQFTDEQKALILHKYHEGVALKRLKEDFNTSYDVIHRIVNKASDTS